MSAPTHINSSPGGIRESFETARSYNSADIRDSIDWHNNMRIIRHMKSDETITVMEINDELSSTKDCQVSTEGGSFTMTPTDGESLKMNKRRSKLRLAAIMIALFVSLGTAPGFACWYWLTDFIVVVIYFRSRRDHHCHGHSNNQCILEVLLRVHLGGQCLPLGTSMCRSCLGQTIRHLGTQASLVGSSMSVLLCFFDLRSCANHGSIVDRTCTPRHRRRGSRAISAHHDQ